MKDEPDGSPLAEQAAQQEDTATEFEAGTEPLAHRRTIVTVERETVSVLIRRPVEGPADQPADGESGSEPQDKNSPGASPETWNKLGGGKA